MDGAKVSVFNETGSPILCGAIKINDVLTVKGQTYTIDCDLACGDGIIVSLNRADGKERCIHVYEVTATGYTYTGIFDIAIFFHVNESSFRQPYLKIRPLCSQNKFETSDHCSNNKKFEIKGRNIWALTKFFNYKSFRISCR